MGPHGHLEYLVESQNAFFMIDFSYWWLISLIETLFYTYILILEEETLEA